MSDKNNFQINLIVKILKIIQVKFYLNELTKIIQRIYQMSETNNFRINLLTKNLIVYLCEILSEQDKIIRKIYLMSDKNNLQINIQTKTRKNYSPENSLIHTKSMP